MIVIRKTPNADTRTADHKVSKKELLDNSRAHIQDVAKALNWMSDQLKAIGSMHDWTKIVYMNEFYDNYQQMQSGFQGDFKQMHWYKDLHLQERHHLKDKCPEDVNLFDVLERIADGTMAGLARSGEIYEDNLDPDILIRAYKNTMKLLRDNTLVEKK